MSTPASSFASLRSRAEARFAAASSSLSAYMPAYYLFLFSASLPLAAINVLQGDSIYVTIGTTIFNITTITAFTTTIIFTTYEPCWFKPSIWVGFAMEGLCCCVSMVLCEQDQRCKMVGMMVLSCT